MNIQHDTLLVDTSQIPKFERGFKSWSDNTAKTIRSRLGLLKSSPLSPYKLADYLNVKIIKPHDITGLPQETIEYLTSSKGNEWSAVTLRDKIDIIIINTFHSERRIANTVMHELSHIIRNHDSAQVFMNETGITIRSYNALQEAEADWLGGTLLLPRDVLVHCHFRNYTVEEACGIYGVSSSLFNYRMNISAVKKQFKRNYWHKKI